MKKLVVKLFLIIIILSALANVFYRKYEEQILKNEVNNLITKNLAEDNFNTKIKTNGKYIEVESAIKTYLNDYSNNVKEILVIINDDNLKSILSAKNYEIDGPSFVNTTNYLLTTRENFNTKMEKLIELTNEENILSYIKNKDLSNYYEELYKKYMLKEQFKQEIEDSILDLKQSSENINNLIEKEKKVIDFLIICKGWAIKENQIIFSSEADLATYNNLISEIS